MRKSVFTAALAASLLSSPSAFALGTLNKTWVSINGTDAGLCTADAPCRSFPYALSQTVSGGQIGVLTPGNYGPVTITQSISIINDSAGLATITVVSGSGITIQAGSSGVVSLRGLTIQGTSAAVAGIKVLSASRLNVFDCDIHDVDYNHQTGFGYGIFFNSSTFVLFVIANTRITNSYSGIVFTSQSSFQNGVVDNLILSNLSNAGLSAGGPGLTLVDINNSTFSGDNVGIEALNETTLTVSNSVLANNNTALSAVGGSAGIRITRLKIHDNGAGYSIQSGGNIVSYGDNLIDQNSANFGTLSTGTFH